MTIKQISQCNKIKKFVTQNFEAELQMLYLNTPAEQVFTFYPLTSPVPLAVEKEEPKFVASIELSFYV